MMRLLQILAVVLLAVLPATAAGQERPAAVAVTVDAGRLHSLDTYLSPLCYSGMHLRVGFERLRATRFNPEAWVNQVSAGVTYDHPSNPAGNNSLHTLIADLGWSMMWRKPLPVDGLTVYAGGALGFDGGVTYNPRNSNNVCSPVINLQAGPTGMLAYRTSLGRLPLTLRWQATVPVVGGFFLPDYDQSFYEIYLGNYGPAVNFGWWGNRFDMENLLTADFHFGASSLRLGYRNEFTTLFENNISVRRCVHSLVVGVSWESVRVNLRRADRERAGSISALY